MFDWSYWAWEHFFGDVMGNAADRFHVRNSLAGRISQIFYMFENLVLLFEGFLYILLTNGKS